MYLLKISTMELERFRSMESLPKYAILSHTWSTDMNDPEEDFESWNEQRRAEAIAAMKMQSKKDWLGLPGRLRKLVGFCKTALDSEIEYVWIDTLCIDKRSSAELSEAINAMWTYYRKAAICIVCFSDTWFTRGWTLQELLAPKEVLFFDQETWDFLGTKSTLAPAIRKSTRLPLEVLIHGYGALRSTPRCVAERFSWAAERHTTRPEDKAYSLLGIFGIHIPILYGEGLANAFYRLQVEVFLKTGDYSTFACRIEQAEISSPGVKIAPTLFGYGPESYLIGPDGPQFKSLPNYEEIWGSIPRHPEGERGITFHRSGLPIQLAVIGVDEDLTPVDTASKIPEYYLGILPVTVANTEHVQFLSGHKEIHAAEEIPPCITIILKPRSAVGSDLVRVSHTPKFGGYGFLYTSHSPPSGLYLSRWIARFVTGNPVRIKILEFYIPSRLPGDSNNNYTCQLGPEGIVTWNLRVPKIQSGHFDIEIVELAWRFKLEGQNLSYHTTRYGSTKVYPFETSGRISSRAHTYGYGAFIGHLWDPHRCEGLMFALVTSIDPGSKLEHCILDIRCTAATNVDWLKPEAVLKALLRSCKDPPYQPEVSEDYVGGHDDAYESNVKWKDDEIKHRDTPPPLLKSSYMAFGDIGLGQTVRILPLPLSKRWIKVEICSEHPGEPLTYLKTTLTIKMIGF